MNGIKQRFASLNRKKQVELDELEENNMKRLAEPTLKKFGLLDCFQK